LIVWFSPKDYKDCAFGAYAIFGNLWGLLIVDESDRISFIRPIEIGAAKKSGTG
jgi:hypothetical protein